MNYYIIRISCCSDVFTFDFEPVFAQIDYLQWTLHGRVNPFQPSVASHLEISYYNHWFLYEMQYWIKMS